MGTSTLTEGLHLAHGLARRHSFCRLLNRLALEDRDLCSLCPRVTYPHPAYVLWRKGRMYAGVKRESDADELSSPRDAFASIDGIYSIVGDSIGVGGE